MMLGPWLASGVHVAMLCSAALGDHLSSLLTFCAAGCTMA